MRMSAHSSKNKKKSYDPHLSIDLKSIYKTDPSQEDDIINYGDFQIQKNNEGNEMDYDYDASNRSDSYHKSKRRHRHSHSSHHQRFSQSSKESRSNYFNSDNKKYNINHVTSDYEKAKGSINEYNQHTENGINGFYISNNDNSSYKHLKFSYKNCDSDDVDDDMNISVNDDGDNIDDFDDVYHFNCKQYVEEEKNTNIRNFYSSCSFKRNEDENRNKKGKKHTKSLSYRKKELIPKIIFQDSDQIDDSLYNFIEEEDFNEKARTRNRRTSHRHHHKRNKQIEVALKDNENNEDYYYNSRRKPLNELYQKYMNVNSKNEGYNNDTSNIIPNDKNVKENLNSSNFDFSEKSLPITLFCGQKVLTSNRSSDITASVSNSRKEISDAPKYRIYHDKDQNAKIKFVGSEEISSGKVDDYIDFLGLENNENNEMDEMNETEAVQDFCFEDINLKISVKDSNSNVKEKVQEFNIYSLKNDHEFNNQNELFEFEEEEESNQTKINKNKESSHQLTEKSEINDEYDAKVFVNIRNDEVNNNNSINSLENVSNNIMKNSNLNWREEESEDSVASFCDASTSFDSQNQIEDLKNQNQQNKDETNAISIVPNDTEEKKQYKTAEINVRLKDIREAVGNSNIKNKSPKKVKRIVKKVYKSNPIIVTTHRRRLNRSYYRKKLVDAYVQTDDVDRPELTLAMLNPHFI